MIYQVERQFNNQKIVIPVRTKSKERIVVRAVHPKKPYTVYFDAAPIIAGVDDITIKIPKMPKAVNIDVYNEKNGNVDFDSTFQVGKISVTPINVTEWRFVDSSVKSFASFSDNFAEHAGVISSQNDIYVSPDGKFRIHYKDVIRDDAGKELKTPARINSRTGEIEIAKKYYRGYTVPGRKAINWHEFSHVFKNANPSDEMEADKNAIMIYLALGNPVVEAYNVFLKVFAGTRDKNGQPLNINRARYDELNKFIRSFSKEINQQQQLKP